MINGAGSKHAEIHLFFVVNYLYKNKLINKCIICKNCSPLFFLLCNYC